MRSKIARAGVIAAEALGLAVAALLALSAFLLWRVQSSPVDLDWAAPAVRSAANAAVFNGAVSRIGEISLEKAEGRGGYRLKLRDVRLGRRGAEATARFPLVDLTFHPGDIFSRRAGPRQVRIDGAELRIIRRADRKLRMDFGEGASERARVFQSLTGGPYFREAFERAELRNATVSFVDKASGRTWIGRDGRIDVLRTKRGYQARFASRFSIGGAQASLTLKSDYDLSTDVISARLSLADAPVGDLVAVFFGEDAELLSSPVSGEAAIDLNSHGAVLSSRIDLRAGEGKLSLGKWSSNIRTFSASAAFDPAKNAFAVNRVAWDGDFGAGAVSGVVSLVADKTKRGVERVNFALASDRLTVADPKLLPEPLPVAGAAVKGSYAPTSRTFDVAAVSASIFNARIEGRLKRAPSAASAQAKLEGSLDKVELLRIWPLNVAEGARDFVQRRVPRGRFSGVDFAMNAKARTPGLPMPDEAMTLTFRADGADIIYAPGMTPLTNVSGAGVLRGNSFKFVAAKGSVGDVRVAKGEFEIPVIAPKGEPTFIRVTADGDAGDIIGVLAQEPLAVLKDTKFTPAQFSGPVAFNVEISRPNLREAPREDYRYKGVATFTGLAVENIIGEATLTKGKGRLDLATAGLIVKADARFGEAPVTIDWRQRFYGAGDKTLITVTGEADSGAADLFGVPTRQFLQGTVPFTAKATGGVDAFRTLELEADFAGAALMSERLGWMKPAGKAAAGAAKFAFSKDGTKISEFSLIGDGIALKGAASFAPSGTIETLDLPAFRLDGGADLALQARRSETGALDLSARGSYLNAAEIVRDLIDNGLDDGAGKRPTSISARIDRIDLRGGAVFRDASLDFSRGAERIEAFGFSATGANGEPLAVRLNKSGGGQVIEAESKDVGAMLEGVFGLSSIKGGSGRLEVDMSPGEPPRAGSLEAHDLRVVKAPLLAKIFAAGSLTGLADLMNGEGIAFESAMAKFAIEKGEVRISEARATGSSVGITGAGEVALGGGREIALKGAVAPAYQVNSFLGKAPVIGELFVSRKGEGVLALSYEVDGPAGAPRVTVNPLSALTPGVLRRMFEGGRANEEATVD